MNDILLDTEKKTAPFDGNYFSSHTYGIEDKYYYACGLESELPLWKRQEATGKRIAFNKNAFLDPIRFFFKRGMSAWLTVYSIALFISFSVLFSLSVSYVYSGEEITLPEEPRYSYSESCRMRETLIDDAIGDCPRYILLRQDTELVPELEATRRKLNEVMKSDEYKQLTEYMEQAHEYETAVSKAEARHSFIFDKLPVLVYLPCFFAVNLIISLFSDYIYSQWARKQILGIIVLYEEGERTEKRFSALAEASFRRQIQNAANIKNILFK